MIFKYLELYEKFRRGEINEQARTEAKGWAGLFNGFRDKESSAPPIRVVDYLPFPKEEEDGKQQRVFTSETASLLVELLNKNAIPPRVQVFIKPIPQIKELIE